MPGSQVDSRNYRLNGNRVAWESTIKAEKFRRGKGVSQVEGTVVATFAGGKIISLRYPLPSDTAENRGSLTAGAGTELPRMPADVPWMTLFRRSPQAVVR
jgi:hypothetical protein